MHAGAPRVGGALGTHTPRNMSGVCAGAGTVRVPQAATMPGLVRLLGRRRYRSCILWLFFGLGQMRLHYRA